MNAEARAAARARCEAATEGPWAAASNNRRKDGIALVAAGSEGTSAPVAVLAGARFTIKRRHANAEFIAHARTDLPAALAALEAAEKERAVLRDLVRQAAELTDPHTGAIGARVRMLHADLATALTFEQEVDHE